MSEESRKNQQKNKTDAKDQRKPRQRNRPSAEKKIEKNVEPAKVPTQTKPVCEEPGPEFYKNLKRETDEILKITEEANSKFKKKEIQSNWMKYEIPIESYEQIDEQENRGADYEKLIQNSSIGGHFQFKHEKSWDINTGPSLYDKYFEINMENLAIALSTIPFYERNDLELTYFSDIDRQNMDGRSKRYKIKYYDDLRSSGSKVEEQYLKEDNIAKDIARKTIEKLRSPDNKVKDSAVSKDTTLAEEGSIQIDKTENNLDSHSEILENTSIVPDIISQVEEIKTESQIDNTVKDDIDDIILEKLANNDTIVSNDMRNVERIPEKDTEAKITDAPNKEAVKPVIESPEDLEKWLDDFLDG